MVEVFAYASRDYLWRPVTQVSPQEHSFGYRQLKVPGLSGNKVARRSTRFLKGPEPNVYQTVCDKD
jgi:hypothetical protein